MRSRGKVFLVGAGPGDPELLTLKAVRCLERADVVVYDRLVDERVLSYCRGRRIAVGKARGCHSWTQTAINGLLVDLGQAGHQVVRLKGGDPYLFGRGGEEWDAVTAAGIACEVVPGVSSALAVPASAGIPVTHRGTSSSLTVVSGHDHPSQGTTDWATLASLDGTLVVLMGMQHLAAIAEALVSNGMSPHMPAAVVQEGTTARQRVATGTLSTIVVAAAGLQAPAVIVIGDVTSRAFELSLPTEQRSIA
ncbi:MAG TPA: uroporphyrinogen-III C-methyltransferase [Candidatus Xenobia bacterium]|jgi:uroporphyrin-III C-methyltransferase